jgi:outer membrane protein
MEQTMRTHIAVLSSLILLFSGVLFAQPKVVSVNEALQMALERNISVVQSQNNQESAKSQVLSAYGGYLPNLSASGNWGRTQSQQTGTSVQVIQGVPVTSDQFGVHSNWSTGVSSNLTIFDGLARESQLSSAKSGEIIAEKNTVRTRQSIAYQVIASYSNIARTRELVKVAEENVKRDQRQLERITESNRVGALSMADVYRQQSQVANDELDVINAQNSHEKAKADLVALIGLDPSLEYDFTDPSRRSELDSVSVEQTMERYRDVAQLAKLALTNRPDYVAARENLNATEAGITSARAGYIPTVGASASYSNFSNTLDMLALNKNYSLSWGIGIRWTLFDRFLTNQNLQSAIAQKRNAEITLTQTEKDISVEVRKAILDLEAARKSWDVSLKVLISANADRNIAEERYNLGAGTLLDLLVANATYVGAQATRINAMAGFLIAKYNVEFMMAERVY